MPLKSYIDLYVYIFHLHKKATKNYNLHKYHFVPSNPCFLIFCILKYYRHLNLGDMYNIIYQCHQIYDRSVRNDMFLKYYVPYFCRRIVFHYPKWCREIYDRCRWCSRYGHELDQKSCSLCWDISKHSFEELYTVYWNHRWLGRCQLFHTIGM